MNVYDPFDRDDARIFMLTNEEMRKLVLAVYHPSNAAIESFENILKALDNKDIKKAKMECEIGVRLVKDFYNDLGECFKERHVTIQEEMDQWNRENKVIMKFYKENYKELT